MWHLVANLSITLNYLLFLLSIDARTFRPACCYKNGKPVNVNDEYGKNATNPVEEARERLIDLELNIERRYLKAPLGSNANINLQTITARITNTSRKARENEEKQNMVTTLSLNLGS